MITRYCIIILWLLIPYFLLSAINCDSLPNERPKKLLTDTVFISGNVTYFDGRAIENAAVVLINKEKVSVYTKTDSNGFYRLPAKKGEDYYLKVRNDAPDWGEKSGISTYDLLLLTDAITKAITDKPAPDIPKQLLAGDVNHSRHLTAYDLMLMRQHTLGNIKHFYRHPYPWIYFDKSYQFFNPSNPFVRRNSKDILPELISITNLQVARQIDWIGFRLGDINGSVKMNSLDIPKPKLSSKTFILSTKQKIIEKGARRRVSFYLSNIEDLVGLQFTLAFDPTILTFKALYPHEGNYANEGTSEPNFGLNRTSEGYLTFSANNFNIANNSLLFELDFIAHQTINTTAAIHINSAIIDSEAYTPDLDTYLLIDSIAPFKQLPQEIQVFENLTVPSGSPFQIGFYLEQKAAVKLSILDLTRKVIKAETYSLSEGKQFILVDQLKLNRGIYFYQIESTLGKIEGRITVR